MTTDPIIQCPNCKAEIKLTESLAAPLVESARQEFQKAAAAKEVQFTIRERSLLEEQQRVAARAASVDEQVFSKVVAERSRIAAEEAKKAKDAAATELLQRDQHNKDLALTIATQRQVQEQMEAKLATAQQAQANFLRKERDLDQQKREMELTIERRIGDSLANLRRDAKREVEDDMGLKLVEKDQVIASMAKQVEELRQKAEQGSQQAQGEALEVVLEASLKAAFVRDSIDPVAKGVLGADVIQAVLSPGGVKCGGIIWESKRTKNWNDAWLPKLREDQRAAGAEVAVIVTTVLPKGIETFGVIDGVWITEPRYMVPLATCLRQALLDIAATRQAGEGQSTKQEMLYQYMTGPRFRHRIGAIVESFVAMKDDLDKERRSTTRSWAKREQQINGVLDAASGMYGDLQGIAGAAVSDLPVLDGPTPNLEAKLLAA